MPRGYAGRLLRVDLTSGKWKAEELPEGMMRDFVGGNGFAAYIMFNELKPGVDPLGPDNILMFMTGPLTGTPFPSSGRYAAYAKSPLTTAVWGEAHSGGYWGPELKYAGFDGIVITGRAEKPVYLWIHDGEVEIRDASHIWGLDVFETETVIKQELGDDRVKVACIGPAGEKLVRLACIMNDLYRAAGRCGLGAVMGSKKLKAIAVRGSMDIEVERPDEFMEVVKELLAKMKENPVTGQALPTYGTDVLTNIINTAGGLPTFNFQQGWHPDAWLNSGEHMRDTILVKNRGCRFCWIRCARFCAVTTGPYAGVVGEGPEYETVWAFGSQCGVFRLDAIHAANTLCNRYGLDTISTGNIIGWAMELYERGILTKEDTDGLDLHFGNHEAMVELVERIALRKGKLGDLLAEGWHRAAEKIGKGSDRLIMAVKGLGLPAYEPRAFWGHALGYATNVRGGCHLRAYMIAPEVLGVPKKMDPLTTEGKAEMCIWFQNYFAFVDSSLVCKFVTFALTPEDFAKAMSACTGWDWDADKVLLTGERIYNLERMIQCREGVGRKDDTLPERFLKEPAPVGPPKGKVVPLKEMLDEYYKLRGWDVETGIPLPETLRRLGLEDAAKTAEELLKKS